MEYLLFQVSEFMCRLFLTDEGGMPLSRTVCGHGWPQPSVHGRIYSVSRKGVSLPCCGRPTPILELIITELGDC